MHLAIVRLRFNPFGGAERFINRLVAGLLDSGKVDRISLLSSEWPRPPLGTNASKLDVIEIDARGTGRYKRQRTFFSSSSNAIKMLPRNCVIQSHERLVGSDIFRAGDGVHRAWLERSARTLSGFRAFLRRLDPYHQLICANEAALANDPRTIFVANSPMCQEDIKNYLNVPPERIRMIPNGIDTEHWASLKANSPPKSQAKVSFGLDAWMPCVLFVGSGFDRKGVLPLLQALSMLKHVQALIVGADKSILAYEALARRLAPGRVVFTGGLHNISAALSAGDVFALPSQYDSLSNAALEALAFGLPVVLSRDNGLASFIVEHGGGELCQQDPGSVASSIAISLGKLEVLTQQAQALSRHFDHVPVVQSWLDLYSSLRPHRAS